MGMGSYFEFQYDDVGQIIIDVSNTERQEKYPKNDRRLVSVRIPNRVISLMDRYLDLYQSRADIAMNAVRALIIDFSKCFGNMSEALINEEVYGSKSVEWIRWEYTERLMNLEELLYKVYEGSTESTQLVLKMKPELHDRMKFYIEIVDFEDAFSVSSTRFVELAIIWYLKDLIYDEFTWEDVRRELSPENYASLLAMEERIRDDAIKEHYKRNSSRKVM